MIRVTLERTNFQPFLFGLMFCLALLPSHATIRIVAAENFYGGVAQEIGGEGVSVISVLTNPNQDPHEFASNVETARAVADADVVIYNGLDYDPWMDKLLSIKGKPSRIVICVAQLVGLSAGANPHLWYQPPNMLSLAKRLVAVLTLLDKSLSPKYQGRLADFQTSLQPVLTEINKLKLHFQGTPVTATEPVFGYMAQALGLPMLNESFQWKIMNETEPGVAEIAVFENSLTTRTARILFYNSQVTDPTTERLQKLARLSGVPTVGVTETQPLDQKSYATWMLSQLQAVALALATIHLGTTNHQPLTTN